MMKTMKTKIFAAGCVLGLSAALTSCSEQMDSHHWTNHDYDYISETFSSVNSFVTAVYSQLDNGYARYGNVMDASACDEAVYSSKGSSADYFFDGTWGPTTPITGMWADCYAAISDCNNYLSDFADKLSFPEYEYDANYQKDLYKYQKSTYEVRALRAYYYFLLVQRFGDVPLVITKISKEEVNQLTRTPAEDVMKYICDECDSVTKHLPYGWSTGSEVKTAEPGRVNALFSQALKARTLLYAASPLFNKNNDQSLWLKAAKASSELIKAATDAGLKLETYEKIWDKDNYTGSKEVIFARRLGQTYSYEAANFPLGTEKGNGGNCPSQTLVEAYGLKDGIDVDWNDPAAATELIANNDEDATKLDPRFAMTILVNGETGWPKELSGKQLETFEGGANGLPIVGATPTGYYLKKLLNGSVNFAASSTQKPLHNWVIFRLGEFYLNYAEAAFRATGSPTAVPEGCDMTATEAVNVIRQRAGVDMPALSSTLSNNEFWSRYEKERMVELAFEGHRFFDIRRWKEGKEHADVLVMKITKDTDGKLSYKRETINRPWDDKMYFFPIPITETMKNPNLGQNPGWK